jgi:hypothetical protein
VNRAAECSGSRGPAQSMCSVRIPSAPLGRFGSFFLLPAGARHTVFLDRIRIEGLEVHDDPQCRIDAAHLVEAEASDAFS